MKTKFFIASLTILALSFILPSCGSIQGPENWTVEIEDSYRVQMALGFDYLVYDEDAVDELADAVEELATKQYDANLLEENVAQYKLALEQMAPNNAGAAELLQIYNSLDVNFSEFVEQPKNDGFSVWTATEENTGIKVTFKNNSALEWDLELDEETLVAYMTKVAEKYVSQQQEELGFGSETEDMDENPAVELIRSRISAQYDGAYTDKQIMSNAFYTLFQKAQQTDESEIGWPDWDYWNCTNGLDANLSSVDVEIKSTNTAVAHVVLSYPETGSFTKVDMPMVYENGNWFVDDIISYENNEKWSLRKSAESVIMNAN